MVFALVGALIGAALARFTFPALIPVMAGAVIIALNATWSMWTRVLPNRITQNRAHHKAEDCERGKNQCLAERDWPAASVSRSSEHSTRTKIRPRLVVFWHLANPLILQSLVRPLALNVADGQHVSKKLYIVHISSSKPAIVVY